MPSKRASAAAERAGQIAGLATPRRALLRWLALLRLAPLSASISLIRVGFARAFIARELCHARGQRLTLFTQAVERTSLISSSVLHRVQAFREVSQAVARTLQVGEQRAHLVVGFERAARRFIARISMASALFTGRIEQHVRFAKGRRVPPGRGRLPRQNRRSRRAR